MMHRKYDSTTELWAVVNNVGSVMFSRGGSSTKQKLMVYETEGKARSALSSRWIQQVIDPSTVSIVKIYDVGE